MSLSSKEKLLMSLRSPYLWMVRGVIALSGLLYTPWMLFLLPLSELIVQTWFDQIFKSRLEEDSAAGDRDFARQLSREDAKWYEHIKDCLAQVRDRLPDVQYAPQVQVDALAQDVLRRLLTLRRAQALDHETSEEEISSELERTGKAAAAEKNDRVREVLEERKALQGQRLELKKRLQGRVRELGAQLKLIEDQIAFLRDTVLSSEVQQGRALDEEAQSALKDQIDILNRQMRICSDLDDEVHSMLKTGSMQRVDKESRDV